MRWPLSLDTAAIHLIWIACLMLVAGFYGLYQALRGWKLDNHPVCRRCRFDLTGLPEDRTQCPECGLNIAKGRHVIRGNRAKRPKLLWLSCLLLAASLVMAIPSTQHLIQTKRWFNYMPVWLLRIQTQHDTDWEAQSWYQLIHRYELNQLTANQTQQLIHDAMALQADFDRPWMLHAGMVIELAFKRGDLAQKQ